MAETIEEEVKRLRAENETLKADVALYVEQKQRDSEAFGKMRIALAQFAAAGAAVAQLHDEHKNSGV